MRDVGLCAATQSLSLRHGAAIDAELVGQGGLGELRIQPCIANANCHRIGHKRACKGGGNGWSEQDRACVAQRMPRA